MPLYRLPDGVCEMLVYFAVILTVMVGFCGLAVDAARMELRTNQLQAAADAGALAAAGELAHGGTGSNYQTAATTDIAAFEAANGIPQTSTNTTVVGATYGNYINDNSTVQVTVTQNLPTVFMGLLTNLSSVTLSAKAVARMPPCMVFLGNPTYQGTYDVWVTSSGIQTFTWGCPYYVKDGFVIDGFSHLAGGQVRSLSGASSSIIQGWTQSTPIYNVPPIQDPLAYITAPTPAACTNASPISDLNQPTATTITLYPGTYCGKTNASPTYFAGPGANCGVPGSITTAAIDVEGTQYPTTYNGQGCPYQNNQPFSYCQTTPTLNFSPGLYIIIGGMALDCVKVTGSGVTLYFTKSSTVGYGQMRMTSSMWQVNAPNDASNGGIPGIILMSDRNWSGTPQDFLFQFSNWNGDGVLYVTGTGIGEYNTPMDSPNYMNMVTANLYSYLGEVHATQNYANLPAGNPLHQVVTLVQ